MNQQVQTILARVRYATISTTDEYGKAWAAPVWYVKDDQLTIYWWSSTSAQHSKNIERSSDAYITIFDSSAPEGDGLGVYIRAQAGLVADEELDRVIALYNQSTKLFKLSRENTSGGAPTRLYRAVPDTIQVNDGIETDGYYQDVRRDISVKE